MPVTLSIGADVQVNDQKIPRSTVNASIKNLFDAQEKLNIKGIIAGLDAELPGINAEVNADMKSAQVKSNIKIDLKSVMAVAAPLIPKFPSPSDISGLIEFTGSAGTNPENPLAFDAHLTGSDLEVSGQVIKEKSIGPGKFSVHLTGIIDLQAEQLDLNTGDIHILENSHIHASGQVEQLKQDDKTIHLKMSDLYLDVDELNSFARPFIPKTIEIKHPDQKSRSWLNHSQNHSQAFQKFSI